MNKILILLFLWSICFMAACSSNLPEVEVTPAETLEVQIPTQENAKPTATKEITATIKPTLEITDTPQATETPVDTPVGDSGLAANREVTETLLLEYDPSETNFIYMETSPDGYHLAYTKFTDQGEYVVFEGQEQGPYDEIVSLLNFSPDSQHLAYAARLGDKTFAVVDSVEQTYYDEVYPPIIFSPDSQKNAYIAIKDRKSIAVIDGQEISYDEISRIKFSPDSEHYMFVARDLNANAFVVLDGKEGKKYDDIELYNLDLYFSPDGNHHAYLAKTGNDWVAVIDGEEGPPMGHSYRGVVFSPDSEHYAYDGQIGGKMVVILDGTKLDDFDNSSNPEFSPDSQRLAYRASLNGDSFVVVDGEKGPINDGYITNITFSPDSQRLAYRADLDGKEVMIIDGEIQLDTWSYPIFSPDSQHVAYSTHDGGIEHLIFDGEEIEKYDTINNITFSPDSNHLLFIAQDDDIWDEYVVVDGIEGKKYDDILMHNVSESIIFDSPNKFHYLAIQGDEVYLVEELIK